MFDQKELNDLIRDLNLSKESSEVLSSRLKDKDLLDEDTNISLYWNRDAEFIALFNQTLEIVYCSDIKRVLLMLGVDKYDPNSWWLFIDRSKRSLKCVFLHNTKKYTSIPTGHSTTLKEKYDPRSK